MINLIQCSKTEYTFVKQKSFCDVKANNASSGLREKLYLLTSFSTKHTLRSNITLQEVRSTKELKTDQSRTMLTADMGIGMVVMDREDYINKAEILLGQGHLQIHFQRPNLQTKKSPYM